MTSPAGSGESNGPSFVIAATFTADLVRKPLEYWLRQIDRDLQVVLAPYGQIFQPLLDPHSAFCTCTGYGAVLICADDWLRPEADVAHDESLATDLFNAIQEASRRSLLSHYFVVFCPPRPGQLDERCAVWERDLCTRLDRVNRVAAVPSARILKHYELDDYYDPDTDELGHIPYTPQFFAALGTALARLVAAAERPELKVIVVDCDDTLWTGVVGEDGWEAIVIDHHRRSIQQFLRDQHDSGTLVCICSRNNSHDVTAVFEHRAADMVLRRAHLAAERVNWDAKSQNVRSLATDLRCAFDVMIYVDDDPIQCAEVAAGCPGIRVVELPRDAAQAAHMLRHVWEFDRIRRTREDGLRTAFVQENARRAAAEGAAASLEAFLSQLGLELTFAPLKEADLPRVIQLMHRTTQFNCSNRVWQEPQLIDRCIEGSEVCVTVRVRDRFGDYGLVGVLIVVPRDDRLLVDTFLLSCRALGRGVEPAMLQYVLRLAEDRGVPFIDVAFRSSSRNEPARAFLSSEGTPLAPADGGPGTFRFTVVDFQSDAVSRTRAEIA